ncbi:hypothetical protein JW968_05650 [Candidatus Woesearchaeota archaeon]|nr:hypothetical protein [Candidatus Woesearchaeota archaeon]
MDVSIFEEIGFTNAETKVYLALLELGNTTAGPVLKKTGLQNSVVHLTLKKLVGKGYVSFVLKGKRRYYQAADPKHILTSIKERERKFQSILPELELKREMSTNLPEAEVYEGLAGFKNMIYDAVGSLKKGDEWLFFSFYSEDQKYDIVHEFYKNLDEARLQKGAIVKGLLPKHIQIRERGAKVKLKIADFPILTNITILKDRVLFTPFGEKPISFMIKSGELSNMFINYFYEIWNKVD